MSGHIPDLEEMSDRPPDDVTERKTDPGYRRESFHEERPPAGDDESERRSSSRVERELSAAIVLLDLRTRQLERDETKRQIEGVRHEVFGLREMIVRVDEEKEAKHKRDLDTMMAEMRSRTPGPEWKGIVIAMIAVGLLGLGGLGVFVFRGAVALERIQQQQQDRDR